MGEHDKVKVSKCAGASKVGEGDERNDMWYIAGDIGGTKTALGVYSKDTGPFDPIIERRYSSRDFTNFETLLGEFVGDLEVQPVMAILGIAGRVSGSQARTSNLPWLIDAGVIRKQFNIGIVHLVNDVEAMAYAIPKLDAERDFVILHHGSCEVNGVRALIAPGTGLGEAYITSRGDAWEVHASEGGHADFPPANELEWGLFTYLKQRYRHVSCEHVCSGKGICNIYDYLKETGCYREPTWLRDEIAVSEDKTRVVISTFLDPSRREPLCTATLELFMSILGAEAGNLALKALATGGVYLGGGIPRIISSALAESVFIEAFTGKGRHSDLLLQIPVSIITNERASLIGAASFAPMLSGS